VAGGSVRSREQRGRDNIRQHKALKQRVRDVIDDAMRRVADGVDSDPDSDSDSFERYYRVAGGPYFRIGKFVFVVEVDLQTPLSTSSTDDAIKRACTVAVVGVLGRRRLYHKHLGKNLLGFGVSDLCLVEANINLKQSGFAQASFDREKVEPALPHFHAVSGN